MRQKSILALIGVLVLVLTPLTAVVADQLFHTVRLSLGLTLDGALHGHPVLRSGHVVDIHPNGPVNGALERYMINGAKRNTEYDVVLRIFNLDCTGVATPGLDPLTTTTLITDKNGNAQGKVAFPPLSLPLPSFGIRWTLVAVNEVPVVVAYETDCITVGVD